KDELIKENTRLINEVEQLEISNSRLEVNNQKLVNRNNELIEINTALKIVFNNDDTRNFFKEKMSLTIGNSIHADNTSNELTIFFQGDFSVSSSSKYIFKLPIKELSLHLYDFNFSDLFENQRLSYLKYYKTLPFMFKIYKIQTENYLLVTFYDNLLNKIPVPEFIECEGFSNGNSVIKNTLPNTNSFLILYSGKYNLYYKKECILSFIPDQKQYFLDFKNCFI
ncbi:2100_t:CDS:2, partial [Cetraspora pellucida]